MSSCFGVLSIRVATFREKSLKNENLSRQGKFREFHFQSGKFAKNDESQGKVRELKKISKKVDS